MGFDIECIVDIQNYPGEYFCPVCRTLVYPNEALQTQCSHLYCKPCLSHIANGTRACPYDGYLVTEHDSKLLFDSDKALAEKIGKVKVHCLFFRSGCAWEGNLSDCATHCSECSLGNSPVICNRCGIQIVHRQVHEHAQSCTGAYDAQQALGVVPGGPTSSGPVPSTAAADMQQAVAQPVAPVSHAPNPANVSVTSHPGQNQPIVTPVSAPTPDQLYQQQYQQYYQQQYAVYQQYYPPQQQPFQPYPQIPPQVQAQQYSQAYTQPHAPVQPQVLPPSQPQFQPQPYPVPQFQHPSHFPPITQGQTPNQFVPQVPPQAQVPPQVQAPVQALTPNYPVNSQQQPHPVIQPPNSQIPPHTLPPPAPYAQPLGVQPQRPHYPNPHLQMHPNQASQVHVQPQMQPQPQISNQTNLQPQPQSLPNHAQSFPQVHPAPPPNQPAAALTPPPPAVTGHHAYQQPQPTQQMQSYPNQHGQVFQQPPVMRPPPQQQPPTYLPPQNQAHPFQHGPVMQQQPFQQAGPQQYSQQQALTAAPVQGQLPPQQSHPHQQPMQPQLRPYGGPSQVQQSQNYAEMQQQNYSQSSGGFSGVPRAGPAQIGSNLTPVNQNSVKPADSFKQEGISNNKSVVSNGVKDALLQPVRKQDETVDSQVVHPSGGIPMKAETKQYSAIKEESPVLGSGTLQLPTDVIKQELTPNSSGYHGPPPKSFESQSADPRGMMGRAPQHHRIEVKDQKSGSSYMSRSGESVPLGPNYGNEPSLRNTIGESWPLNQASMSLHKVPPGSKSNPGAFVPHSRSPPPHHPFPAGQGGNAGFGPGPEFGQHRMNQFPSRSPDKEYRRVSPNGFGSRFPPMPGHPIRGDIDGSRNFGEHMGRGPMYNNHRSDDSFWRDGPNNAIRGDIQSYSFQGFPNNGKYSGDMDSFDQSRMRKHVSMGWCLICEFDCATVEGLETHSQTRDHQNIAMDMVKSIKQKNRKRQRLLP